MYKYLIILICSIFVVGCDQPVAENTAKNSVRDSLTVYTTAKDTDHRLTKTGTYPFRERVQPTEGEISIFVNSSKQFQKFLGIGGSFTDASAEVFAKLDNAKQEEFLEAYYDTEKGIGYSLARTTIHSTDFGSASHTYIDEGDKALETFTIEKDKQFRIPLIKRATEAAGGELLLYASPWSAPAFMKSNNNMLRGGKLLPEYYDSWAKYYTKFIEAYESEGMPIWGISIQNEPMATQRWESMIYTAQEERDFLKNHLGPAMEEAGYGDKNIVVWDHNRDLLTDRANVILDDPEAYKYVWGVGYHWYETWAGGDSMHDNLAAVKESYPEIELLFTEGTVEGFREDRYQYWPNAERYARSMIKDFNIGTVGWTDWNLLLDHTGGPNHVSNFCFAPIHADTRTGELIYTPTYYYIGHFSKFIRPEAKRISTSSSRSVLLATSFINTDNQIATVVMNETDNAIDYHFLADMQQVTLTIPARSMQTLVY
ncbi:MAG: Glucuronoxylanase XynC [Cellvibrionales bacterium UBA7375]|nr:MAG: Glucuronoxylanase XynC [Cellvibrionales bacterium UBA7375]